MNCKYDNILSVYVLLLTNYITNIHPKCVIMNHSESNSCKHYYNWFTINLHSLFNTWMFINNTSWCNIIIIIKHINNIILSNNTSLDVISPYNKQIQYSSDTFFYAVPIVHAPASAVIFIVCSLWVTHSYLVSLPYYPIQGHFHFLERVAKCPGVCIRMLFYYLGCLYINVHVTGIPSVWCCGIKFSFPLWFTSILPCKALTRWSTAVFVSFPTALLFKFPSGASVCYMLMSWSCSNSVLSLFELILPRIFCCIFVLPCSCCIFVCCSVFAEKLTVCLVVYQSRVVRC